MKHSIDNTTETLLIWLIVHVVGGLLMLIPYRPKEGSVIGHTQCPDPHCTLVPDYITGEVYEHIPNSWNVQ